MTATAHVALVVDNTGTQKQRSKRNTPSQSFLTDQHSNLWRRAAWFVTMWALPKTRRNDSVVESGWCILSHPKLSGMTYT